MHLQLYRDCTQYFIAIPGASMSSMSSTARHSRLTFSPVLFLCRPTRHLLFKGVVVHFTSRTSFISAAILVISPVTLSARSSALCNRSVSARKALRSFFTFICSACAASLSSGVGTGGLSSMGGPNGAIMRFTTKRLLLDVRHPLTISTTSPVRRELFGS